MCNHYRTMPAAIPTWAEYAGFSVPADRTIIEDVWPKREGTVARILDGRRILDAMAWGVPMTTPGKRPGMTITKHVNNVRNLKSSFWRSMLANPERRCLVPFSRFAEPKAGQGRDEWWFTVADRPVAAFAAIWRPSELGNVFAFLTCEPNPLVAPLHPKAMPVILAEYDYDRWLSVDYDEACAMAVPFPSQLISVE